MYSIKRRSIILASTSFSRKTLLENASIKFTVHPPFIDEDSIKQSYIAEKKTPQECALLLAETKGAYIARNFPDAFVISGDQILDFGGRCFSKPKNQLQAKKQLLELQGNSHNLHTSVVVFLHGKRIWHHLSSPKVTIRSLTVTEVNDYLGQIGNDALKSPGCYQIESLGCHIINAYTGSFYDILGLPLLPLLKFLRSNGLSVIEKE